MNINVIGPCNFLGYGLTVANVLVELSKLGHRVAFFPIGNIEAHPDNHEIIKQCINNAAFFDRKAPCIRIYHQFSLDLFVGKKRIGFPIFELDTFTEQEKHHLASCDSLFVCSNWAKQIVLNNGIRVPIHVVPLGVDTQIFWPKCTQLDSLSAKHTGFLTAGKWEIRKGHDIVIEAFNRAFNPEDRVSLYALTHNPFYSPSQNKEWEDLYLKSKMGSKVKILERQATQQDVAKLMQSTDCGVFPARAEGWNLELLEMMACGKKVIATNYSGHTEFVNKDNCMLVNTSEVESAIDGIWFKGQGNWASLGEKHIDEIAAYMRKVHEEPKTINKAGIETAKKFSWANCVDQLLKSL